MAAVINLADQHVEPSDADLDFVMSDAMAKVTQRAFVANNDLQKKIHDAIRSRYLMARPTQKT